MFGKKCDVENSESKDGNVLPNKMSITVTQKVQRSSTEKAYTDLKVKGDMKDRMIPMV